MLRLRASCAPPLRSALLAALLGAFIFQDGEQWERVVSRQGNPLAKNTTDRCVSGANRRQRPSGELALVYKGSVSFCCRITAKRGPAKQINNI